MANLELAGELNRLAGTSAQHREVAAAANIWAGLVGANRRELIGALNHKAGLTGANMREFDAVCNLIAGTTNLSGVNALGKIP